MDDTGVSGNVAAEIEVKIERRSTEADSHSSKRSTRKGQTVTKNEAISILTSALNVCRQAGMDVHYGHWDDGRLVLVLPVEVALIFEDGGGYLAWREL